MIWEHWINLSPLGSRHALYIGESMDFFPVSPSLQVCWTTNRSPEIMQSPFAHTINPDDIFMPNVIPEKSLDWVFMEKASVDDSLPGQFSRIKQLLKPGGMLFCIWRRGWKQRIRPIDSMTELLLKTGFKNARTYFLVPPYHFRSILLPFVNLKMMKAVLEHLGLNKGRNLRNRVAIKLLLFMNCFGILRYGWKYSFIVGNKGQTLPNVSKRGQVSRGVSELVERHLRYDDLTVGVYPGNRKCIMPICSMKYGVVGYAKVFMSGKESMLGKNEVKLLRKLNSYDFTKAVVPKVLMEEEKGVQYIVVVSTVKNLKNFNSMNDLHLDWLIDLFNCSAVKMPFRVSHYFHILEDQLDQIKKYLGNREYDWLHSLVIEAIERLYDKEIPFGIAQREFPYYHAFQISGEDRILVIDWELGAESYPPCFDLYHCALSSFRTSRNWNDSKDFVKKKITMFLKSRHVKSVVTNYCNKVGLPRELSYDLFLVYLIDQLLIHLAWDKTDFMVNQRLAALNILASEKEKIRGRWLTG